MDDFMTRIRQILGFGQQMVSQLPKQAYQTVKPKVQQIQQTPYGRLGQKVQDVASYIPRQVLKQTVYNPQTKQLFPLSPYHQVKQLTQQPEYQQLLQGQKRYAELPEPTRRQIIGTGWMFAGMTGDVKPIKGVTPKMARNILRVKKDASLAEINTAYKTLIKKEYPRTVTDLATKYKTNAARLVNEARDVLLREAVEPRPIRITSQPTIPGLLPPSKEAVKPSVGEYLEGLPPTRGQPGSYTNIRALDNPLLLGKDWLARIKTNLKNSVRSALDRGDTGQLEKVQSAVDPDFTKVTKKVNLFDYFKTPENVLNKIGLGKEASFLRKQYETYLKRLPEEIERLRRWSLEAPGAESSKKIFQYLDGQTVDLTKNEMAVASKVRNYLAIWADRLEIPRTDRINQYITHVFSKDAVEAEFNDEIAKLIDRSVAGSVYNPFLLHRKGERIDYIQDVWRALDAYVKRAARKFYMDPALKDIKAVSEGLELSQYKYVSRLTDRVNLRPTEYDTLVDNFIKTIPGIGYRWGQRPTTALTRSLRQTIYRGTLGLNVSSAMRNLTQAANTYGELGERWLVTGYVDLLKNWRSGELERVGVLQDSFIQNQQLAVYKRILDGVDKGLFYLFEKAEKINRGAAYYGEKARAISKGFSEPEAIERAKALTRKTQFVFGSIDTPLVLSSDISKVLLQFQSYNVKQAEYLINKVLKKEFGGLFRYVAATLGFMVLLKKAFGMKLDLLPVNLRAAPAVQIGANVLQMGFGGEREREEAKRELLKSAAIFAPAGVQLKKTYEGLRAYKKGVSESAKGLVRYPIEQTRANLLKGGIFGQYSFPEARRFYETGAKVLGKKQSALVKEAEDRIEEYQKLMAQREENAEVERAKKLVMQTGQSTFYNDKYLYLDESGSVRTIDTAWQPSKPELSQDEDINTELLSDYKTDVNKKAGDIVELYSAGAYDEKEAKKEFEKLRKETRGLVGDHFVFVNADGKCESIDLSFEPEIPTYTGFAYVDKKLKSAFTGDITKAKNIVMRLLEIDEIDASGAEKLLLEIEALKVFGGAGAKGRKPPKINIKKVVAKKLPAITISKTKLPQPIKIKARPRLKIRKPEPLANYL